MHGDLLGEQGDVTGDLGYSRAGLAERPGDLGDATAFGMPGYDGLGQTESPRDTAEDCETDIAQGGQCADRASQLDRQSFPAQPLEPVRGRDEAAQPFGRG
ncbi:hypothetical protein [Nocardia sp. NPDC005998]|uniref:hypothetical protein n=1 Tax=Nocardia sp. NPDC005998 TaxID=3156894 RepID=UPI0033B0B171